MSQKIKVLIEKDFKENIYSITVPALPGCVSQGKTKEEALSRIKESIELTIEGFAELGKKINFKDIEVLLEDIEVAA